MLLILEIAVGVAAGNILTAVIVEKWDDLLPIFAVVVLGAMIAGVGLLIHAGILQPGL